MQAKTVTQRKKKDLFFNKVFLEGVYNILSFFGGENAKNIKNVVASMFGTRQAVAFA